MDFLKREVGADDKGQYLSTYKKKIEEAQAKVTELEGKLTASESARGRLEEVKKELLDLQKKANDRTFAQIQKDAKAALAGLDIQTDSFTKQLDLNKTLSQQVKEKDAELGNRQAEFDDTLRIKDRKIKDLEAAVKELSGLKALGGGGGAVAGGGGQDPFPLMLDISTGAPLWDYPVGKVVRVDLQARQVAINLGSSHGVKPELTFNIFGASSTGRAEKQMKGTIEVVKVLDTSTSLCRITSLYDAEGREILLNLDTRTRLARETENAMREGDLLFNMFWGTRVAIVGYVSVTGEMSSNPADQIRQMEDFMHLLKRNGMIVDAFVDPRDGKIQGNITGRTRYLIQGSRVFSVGEKNGAPVAPKEGEEKEPGMEKDPDKTKLANAERNELINKNSMLLRKDAIDKGLLLISQENFANVIGFRRARAANSHELSTFSPRLPYAGDAVEGKGPPVNEKKDGGENMEKKEGN
jgi:hypothetical protein